MPVLDNPKQEKFARLWAAGNMTMSQAYIEAGYTCNNDTALSSNACRLSNYPNVEARVRELKEKAALRTEIQIVDVIEMLLEDRKLARSLDQPAASIRAAELIGKQLGMFVDKKEIKSGNLEDVDFGTLDRIRGQLVAAAMRTADKTDREGTTRPKDRDVLSGDGAVAPGAVHETHAVLQGGGPAPETADVSEGVQR